MCSELTQRTSPEKNFAVTVMAVILPYIFSSVQTTSQQTWLFHLIWEPCSKKGQLKRKIKILKVISSQVLKIIFPTKKFFCQFFFVFTLQSEQELAAVHHARIAMALLGMKYNKTLPVIKFPGLTTWKELLGRFHKQREALNSQLILIHFCTTTPSILSSDLQKNSPSNLSRLAVGHHQSCRMSLCISGLRQCCRSRCQELRSAWSSSWISVPLTYWKTVDTDMHRVLLHSSHPKAVFKGNPWACRLTDSRSSLKAVMLEVQDQKTQVMNFYLGKGTRKLSMLYHKVKEAAGDSEC